MIMIEVVLPPTFNITRYCWFQELLFGGNVKSYCVMSVHA